ncbi:isopentenyl-diphosphate Delta-isomerase [archaeon]|nr:isopentenyl-diphosphate Delta-isomerase [archaeon]
MVFMYTSAPGKILWIGGYAVLEKGNTSFVTGVDKRVYAKAEKLGNGRVRIVSRQFGIDVSGEFDGTKISFYKELSENEKKYSKFVVVAVETCLRYLRYKGFDVNGIEVETISDPAFGFGDTKSGLGSSAAVTTAVTAAVFGLHGLKIDKNLDLVHKMAQYVHFRVQGKVGSGFDIAASCFGGHAYSRYSPELIKDIPENAPIEQIADAIEKKWDYTAEKIDLPHGFITAMGNFVGQSASTSEMVKKINEWKAANQDEYKELMKDLNDANKEAIRWLKEINALSNDPKYEKILIDVESGKKHEAFYNFKKAFERGRMITKELGDLSGAPIETDDFSKIIEETEKNGAFAAKLPGAGGIQKSGEMAMTDVILVDENDKETGLMEKMEAHKQAKLHRAFSVFIFNSKNDMLLQKRALDKYHCAGLWTNACCSHPNPGEDTEAAAHRRLEEEMGFDTYLNEAFSFIYKAPFDNGLTEHEFDHCFVGFYEGKIKPDPDEVCDWKFISLSNLLEDVKKHPEKYTPWFKIALPRIAKHIKKE